MEKASNLTAKKLVIIIATIFLVCLAALGVIAYMRGNAKQVATQDEYGYINTDETKAETDAGITIDGVLDEKEYQNNNWLYMRNDNGNATVDIAMTSYYGEKGMYFVYDVTESTPIYVNLNRSSAMNSCVELYLATSGVTNMDSSEIFEIDLLPTGDMVFKQRNGKGAFMDVATTKDKMAYLGATTKGGEINTEDCYGYCLEFFIPWDYLDFLGVDVEAVKPDYVFVNTAHITSYNYAGTAETDRYWHSFARELGGNGWSNVSLYYRFNKFGVLGTAPVELVKGDHYTIEGADRVIPGVKTHVTITPEEGYALNSILVNGEEYIKKVSYNEDGSVEIDVRGVKGGLKISAVAEAVTEGTKTLSGTVQVHKVGGDNLSGVVASYKGPKGEKPIELDSNGKFTLADIEQGYYTITVEKEGYEKVTRTIYLNRDIDTEITLEYLMFEVESGNCWQLEEVNDGTINKMGGFGSLITTDSYKKFSVEANFKYYEDVAKSLDEQDRHEQRQGIRIKFSNDKYWHIDLLYQNGKHIIQYAKATTDSIFNYRAVYELSDVEIAQYKSEDGIQLKVVRDGNRGIIYLGENLIAVEDLDKEYASLTARVGFESWGPYTDVRSMEYKITNDTGVDVNALYFGYHKAWDVTKQFEGVVSQPKGGNTVWLRFFEKLTDIDMTIKVLDNPKSDKVVPSTNLRFEFDNDKVFLASIGVDSGTGNIHIWNQKSTTNAKTKSLYQFTAKEQAQYMTEEGIDFRFVRSGTELLFFIGGEYKTSIDLSEYIKADTPAIVSIQHYGDQDVPYVMPFTVSEKTDSVIITQKEGAGKEYKTEKGTTVVVSAEEGYYIKELSINGKDVSKDLTLDGRYIFVADEADYTMKATLVKCIFETTYGWNLLEQNQGTKDGVTTGMVALPDGGTTRTNLTFLEKYADMDLTWRIKDHPDSDAESTTAPRTSFEFIFDEVQKGENKKFVLSVSESNKGVVQIQNYSGLKDKQYTSYYNFDEEDTEKYCSADGIDFRMVRKGTTFFLFVDGEYKTSVDLSEYIKADTKAQVRINHNDDAGVELEMPYSVTDKADIGKIYFGYHRAWDVTKQFEGVVSQPKGGNTVWLRFLEKLTTMDLNIKILDNPNSDEEVPSTNVRFEFDGGETLLVSVGVNSGDGTIHLWNQKSTTNEKTKSLFKFSAEEQAQYETEEGIDFRVVRNGTDILFFLAGEYKACVDLSEFIEGDTPSIVSIQHVGDKGVPYVMPFTLAEEVDLVTIKTEANDGKKLLTDKTSYVVGQEVNVEAEEGYYIKEIIVNGKDASKDLTLHGTYTFVAAESNYEIKATVAKKVFGYAAKWNLLNQNQGINDNGATIGSVSLPEGGTGGGGGYLYFADKYADMDLTWRVQDHPDSAADNTTAPRTTFEFVFDEVLKGDVKTFALSVSDSNKGVVQIQNLRGMGVKEYSSYYDFNSEETAKYRSVDGIDIRIVRDGTEFFLFVDGEYKTTIDLSEYIKADAKATVRFRHDDDKGVEIKMPFAVNDKLNPITITDNTDEKFGSLNTLFAYNGAVVLNEKELKDSTKYLSSIQLDDNVAVALNVNGIVTYNVEGDSHTVTGIYKKAIFEANTQWSLVQQNQGTEDGVTHGVVTLPNGGNMIDDSSEDNLLYLYRSSSSGQKGYDYGDIALTLTLRDYQSVTGTPRYWVKFFFATDDGVKVLRLCVDDTGRIRHSQPDETNLPIGSVKLYDFTTAEKTAYCGDGVEVKILREGTKFSFYVGGVFKKSLDLSAYIENDTKAMIGIGHELEAGVQVDIPYELSFPTKKVIGQDGAKYLSILGDEISMSAGKPENSDNNTTTFTNNTTCIYGNGRDFGIGNDWTKLYWGQSLVTNNLQLLVNNSASDGLLYTTRSGDSSKLAGYLRANQLHDNTDAGIPNGTEPDIIYLYMGTSDYMATAETTPIAEKYEATLQTITSEYGDAEVFCFTVMPYFRSASGFPPESMITRMKTLNNCIRDIASKYENVTLVDIENIITSANYTEYYPSISSNHIMPNAAGHELIAARLQKALESQFAIESQITLVNETENEGYLSINSSKETYALGDKVVIKAEPVNSAYYLHSLTVDGKEVEVTSDGTYELTVSKVSHVVESTFRKKVFRDNENWNLSKQNQGTVDGVTNGTITIPGNTQNWLYLYEKENGVAQYGDVDLTFTLKDFGGSGNSWSQIKFAFKNANNEEKVLFLTVSENNEKAVFEITNSSSMQIGTTICELDYTKYTDKGVDIRVVREGTKILLYADVNNEGENIFKKRIDIPEYIEEGSLARIGINHNGDGGKQIEIPYKLSFPEKESIEGKYLSILGDGISMSTGKPKNSDNNSTTVDNSQNKIYGANGVNLGIGSDWTKLYWGQSLMTNNLQLLVNNSVGEGKLNNPNNTNESSLGTKRANQLHDNTEDGIPVNTKPDIIYLYMGTEDRKQTNCSGFEGKYRETLNTITESYPEAEVFCFTTMAFADKCGKHNETEYRGIDTPIGCSPSAANRMKTVNDAIKKVASEFENVTLVDIADIVSKDNFKTYFPDDGSYVTPHVTAHDIIAARLQKALESQFKVGYGITLNSTGKGELKADKAAYKSGDTATITVTPRNDNCYLAALEVDGLPVEVSATGTYSFTVTQNHVVTATFRDKVAVATSSDTSLFYINDKKTSIADPFVLDNGDGTYYLYGTTASGLDTYAYSSTDLMTWTEVGSVLDASCKEVLQKDIWAPEVVKEGDTYYMFISATPKSDGSVGNAEKQLMVATSKYPDKGFKLVDFTGKRTIDAMKYPQSYTKYLLFEPESYTTFAGGNSGYTGAIDPHLYTDEDGTKYLFWKIEQAPARICVVTMKSWLEPDWNTAKVVLTSEGEDNGNVEAPEVIKHNDKYYLTYSTGTYENNSYQVRVAVADNIIGTYETLSAEKGGILLSGENLGNPSITGTGHHSFITVGEQLYIVYHKHDDANTMGNKRHHAIDEVKWIKNSDNLDVMYVNGPTSTYQPKIGGTYKNIAGEAAVSGTDASYLIDGLLSVQKNGNVTFTDLVKETSITETTTFTFEFGSVKEVGAIMAYNSKNDTTFFKNISRIELIGEDKIYYINNVAFNATTDEGSKVIPGSAAYAVFEPLQNIKIIKITVEVPEGQGKVGISEIKILGK